MDQHHNHTTNIRTINKAITSQAMNGRNRVMVDPQVVEKGRGLRVIAARIRKGQLQARLMDGGWINVDFIIVE